MFVFIHDVSTCTGLFQVNGQHWRTRVYIGDNSVNSVETESGNNKGSKGGRLTHYQYIYEQVCSVETVLTTIDQKKAATTVDQREGRIAIALSTV